MIGCFSGRVDDYVKTRPSYPRGVLDVLARTCRLTRDAGYVVADLGSGTGIFSRLLLDAAAGAREVLGVEPNEEMRAAAEAMLAESDRFRSVAGSAEATTLPDASVDLVTAAQAFHWFDVDAVRIELRRILRPLTDERSNVALVWNDRELDADAFHRDYEELLVRRCPKYRELQGKADAHEKFDALFGGAGGWQRSTVPNEQRLDREGLVGRLLSSSYAPRAGEPGHDETFAELRALYDRHANGAPDLAMLYTTVVITGRIS